MNGWEGKARQSNFSLFTSTLCFVFIISALEINFGNSKYLCIHNWSKVGDKIQKKNMPILSVILFFYMWKVGVHKVQRQHFKKQKINNRAHILCRHRNSEPPAFSRHECIGQRARTENAAKKVRKWQFFITRFALNWWLSACCFPSISAPEDIGSLKNKV
jgi:hypothetical protein